MRAAHIIAYATIAAMSTGLSVAVGFLRAENRRLRATALSDALTRLKNRRYFDERLASELSRHARTGTNLALLIADLDHFKRVNDALGHAAGDDILRAIGQTFAATCRRSDSACRIGGEEFAVICPGADASQAEQLAERLRTAIAALEAHARHVTVSIGIAVATDSTQTPESLFATADKALYLAKCRGRDQVAFADTSDDADAPQNWTVEHELQPGDD